MTKKQNHLLNLRYDAIREGQETGTEGSPAEKQSGAKNGWGEAVNSNDVLGGYARNCNEQRKRTRS